ncbi:MAG TPA: aldehyde dehydrogenase [Bacteroidetes bacterium]|jgi:aldehyde dehydrogenase (NAD+)|nr:aldehyde dehydrogenase [Bacteroidota bacterium]
MPNQDLTITATFKGQKKFFADGKTLALAVRKTQLKKLKEILQANEERLYEAIYADFCKSTFDTYTTEIAILYQEIDEAISNLTKWAKTKKVTTNWVNFPAKSFVMKEPLGVTLIIGAWNYPYQLLLAPAVAAIAAGCSAVLKPSELSSATSALMSELINQHFDPGLLRVIEGGVTETTELLTLSWNKIFFTGSVRVGRIVYAAAAKNLVPVTLELGGKSPAVITEDCNLNMTVKRLVWAKYLNAGQTCIAPDYVMVHKNIAEAFIGAMRSEISKECFSIENGNYVQIINNHNLSRLSALIEPEQVAIGGRVDEKDRVIEPTVLYPSSFQSKAMQEEIFGPILPVIVYNQLETVIDQINEGPKPLAAYIFTSNSSTRDYFLNKVPFGGGAVNDAVMHISNSALPFGGVGNSGIGAYRGKAGFDCFSHAKSVLQKSTLIELNLKYYPHTPGKLNWIRRILKLS